MKTDSVVGLGAFCVAFVLLSACAAKTPTQSAESSRSRNLITASELSGVDAVNVFTAVQLLRPEWLRSRGAMSFTEPQGSLPTVYVDNIRYGEVATLNAIPIAGVSEIRYISGPDATTRWGTGVIGGVIEVVRKRSSNTG